LENSFKIWLSDADKIKNIKLLKAIIESYVEYSYSGSTAAWAYININPLNYKTVFLLGPCHHKYIKGCGLPTCNLYQTPLGNIQVDTETVQKLSQIKNFQMVSKKDEEDEHSLEMHLPFIKKLFGENEFKLVPIMIGSLDRSLEEYFGNILSDYLKDDKNLFIISSDFCHWGRSFDYTYYNQSDGEIHQSIEKLDKLGITYIEKQDPSGFQDYLEETENTICGRHPIAVFLYALKYSGLNTLSETKLLRYNQSSQVKTSKQTSVSYASIATYLC
jgi:AmmeMemoRadiSam system protein B